MLFLNALLPPAVVGAALALVLVNYGPATANEAAQIAGLQARTLSM